MARYFISYILVKGKIREIFLSVRSWFRFLHMIFGSSLLFREQQTIDYRKVDAHVHQLKGSSSRWFFVFPIFFFLPSIGSFCWDGSAFPGILGITSLNKIKVATIFLVAVGDRLDLLPTSYILVLLSEPLLSTVRKGTCTLYHCHCCLTASFIAISNHPSFLKIEDADFKTFPIINTRE